MSVVLQALREWYFQHTFVFPLEMMCHISNDLASIYKNRGCIVEDSFCPLFPFFVAVQPLHQEHLVDVSPQAIYTP